MAKDKICPLMRKRCIEGDCRFWVYVIGKHPQQPEAMPGPIWDCSFAWLPAIMMDMSQRFNHQAQAFEQHRNTTMDMAEGLVKATALASAIPTMLGMNPEEPPALGNGHAGNLIENKGN